MPLGIPLINVKTEFQTFGLFISLHMACVVNCINTCRMVPISEYTTYQFLDIISKKKYDVLHAT